MEGILLAPEGQLYLGSGNGPQGFFTKQEDISAANEGVGILLVYIPLNLLSHHCLGESIQTLLIHCSCMLFQIFIEAL